METLNKCVMLKFQAVSEKLPINDKGYFMTRLYIGTTTLQSIYFVAVATTGGFSACFDNSGWSVCTLQSFGPVCDVLLTAQLVCLGRCLWYWKSAHIFYTATSSLTLVTGALQNPV